MRHSYSAWQAYKQCPFKYKCRYIDHVPVGEPSEALVNGNKVHAAAEAFLKKETETVHSKLMKFDTHLRKLRAMKSLFVEQDMAFTYMWEPCAWDDPNAWLRMKLDVLYPLGLNGTFVGDWKTGKVYPDHAEQLGIYALGCFKGLDSDVVMAEDWYCDTGIKSKTERFDRNRDEKLLQEMWEGRIRRMENDNIFAPTKNRLCGWCEYGKGKGGPCKHG